MAARNIHPLTSAALGQDVVYDAFILRLDIKDDPIQIWTGPRDIVFSGSGDPSLEVDALGNSLTFDGLGDIGGIGDIVDGQGGSQALVLRLAGIDLADDALKQVVFNKNRWQRRQAWVWLATLDADYNLVGQPFRIKTGRMDNMGVGQGRDGENFVEVRVESHQAYSSEASNTKYSEQPDIDSTDISQAYVVDLANRQAIIGGAVANNSSINAGLAALLNLSSPGRNLLAKANAQ